MYTPGRVLLFVAAVHPMIGCGSEGVAASPWTGTIDTLSSGQVVVTNTADPVWRPGNEWRIVEELRIGTVDEDGPDLFGRIVTLEADQAGRIYVMEGQAQELRVFNADGSHLRTVGRKGGGPGEFARVVHVQLGPDGHMWVVDPENNRVSVFDTSGTFLSSRQSPGGFIIIPWPGGFDRAGYYYSPIPRPVDEEFRIALVRYDSVLLPVDTLQVPHDPVERERFELRRGDMFMRASVPFSPSFRWRLAPSGTIWGMLSGEYRLFQLSLEGDTLTTITREFQSLPVTDVDLEAARVSLEWFTNQGGTVDLSRIPKRKPATDVFFFDDEGNIWVTPVAEESDENFVLDVFDPLGRYLGRLRLPFRLTTGPYPLIRNGLMYAVTLDELEVPFVVRARIEKPEQ